VKQRKVEVLHGTGRFVSANVLEVMGASGSQRIRFDQCIIAAGSEPVRLPDYRRIREFSTPPTHSSCRSPPAFAGGGRRHHRAGIGLRVRRAGPSRECGGADPQLMPGTDPDLVRPLERRIRARYQQILLVPAWRASSPSPPGCA